MAKAENWVTVAFLTSTFMALTAIGWVLMVTPGQLTNVQIQARNVAAAN